MSNLNLFLQITKIDEAKRIVYGTLTHAVADKSGEIIDYPSTKAAYQKWSDDTHERSKGKSKGNLRAMHASVAAGKFTDIVFDDANERIEGAAYVSDDNEWKKCLDGTYTGFSHGGSYAKRWKDPDNAALTRYTPELAEVSLVDNPCLPTATFEFIKQDGSSELRKFNINQEVAMTKNTETTKDAETVQKAASADVATTAAEAEIADDIKHAEKTTATVEKSERPQDKGGVEQGFRAKDGSFHLRKADALKRNEAIEVEAISQPALDALKSLTAAITKAESGVKKEDGAEAVTKEAESVNIAAEQAAQVKKGMYAVGNFASLLQAIQSLQQDSEWEAAYEEDESEIPVKLKAWMEAGASLLVQMVGEEAAELTASKAASGDLAKKGAKISAATKEHIVAMHKSACSHMAAMDKSYKDMGMSDDEGTEKSNKGELEKKAVDDMLAGENAALKKTLGDIAPQITALVKRVAELESQPMPSKGALRVVNKGEDGGNVSDGDATKKAAELLKGMTPEEQSMVLMKAALLQPKPITRN